MTKLQSEKNRPINFAVRNTKQVKTLRFVMDLKINFNALWHTELTDKVYEQVDPPQRNQKKAECSPYYWIKYMWTNPLHLTNVCLQKHSTALTRCILWNNN